MDIPEKTVHKLSTKERSKEKNNITTGQINNLKGYHKVDVSTSAKSDKFATDDKQIKREANYLKNIHIDDTLERLRSVGLVNEGYDAWYCKAMHTLGTAKVGALAETALSKARADSSPGALFHWLLNKEMNKAIDKYMPRFNR